MRATVCSVAEIVLASGVFMTRTPFMVAAWISILSTPTPARPMTRRFSACSIFSDVTVVPLLTIHPSMSERSNFEEGSSPDASSTLMSASMRICLPSSEMGSVTNTFINSFH